MALSRKAFSSGVSESCSELTEKSPQHSVFSRSRDQLIKHGVHDRLFDELNRQMDAEGLMLKQGTLIDANVEVERRIQNF